MVGGGEMGRVRGKGGGRGGDSLFLKVLRELSLRRKNERVCSNLDL